VETVLGPQWCHKDCLSSIVHPHHLLGSQGERSTGNIPLLRKSPCHKRVPDTPVALFDFFFFFLPPMQAASPPPHSASKQHRARIPRRIQSHKRLLDEFSVVVVTAVVCCPWVVCPLPVVPGSAVVVLLPIIAPATAKAAAPAITPPTTPFLPGPGGDGPGATVVPQGLPE